MPSLSAAASQHGPAVGGLHAGPESVGFRPMPIVRLKRTFWHYKSFWLMWERQALVSAKMPNGSLARRHTAVGALTSNNQYKSLEKQVSNEAGGRAVSKRCDQHTGTGRKETAWLLLDALGKTGLLFS